MQSSNNVLDLLEDNNKMSKIEYLDDKTMKKIFIIFGTVVLIICIGFIIFGFIGKNEVPVANQDIYSRTQIANEMVTTKGVPRYKLLKDDLIKNKYEIIGKYVVLNEVINKDSYFYEKLLTTKEGLADSSIIEIEDGFVPYQFPISLETYKENNVNQNEKIDIYFEYITNNEKKIGKLISNIRVVDIKDNSGLSVFEPSAEERIPAFMILEVKDEERILLSKYSYMGIELFYSTQEIKTNATKEDLEVYLEKDIVSLPVSLSFTINGNVASGKKIKNFEFEPQVITVTGKDDIVNSMLYYYIELDVDGISEDKIIKVAIPKVYGVTSLSHDTVEVRITLEDE